MKSFISTVAFAAVAVSAQNDELAQANLEGLILGDKTLDMITRTPEMFLSKEDAYEKVGKKVLAPEALMQDGAPVKLTDASIKKAVFLLNDMIESAQEEIDKLTIVCKAFHARNRGLYNAIMSDLGRLGADIVMYDRVKATSTACIADMEAQMQSLEEKINEAKGEYDRLRAIDEAEMTVRKNDLAVGEFIMQVTKCKAKGGPMGLVEMESCSADGVEGVVEDQSVIKFMDPEVQTKLEELVHADSKSLLARALQASYSNSHARGADLLQTVAAEDGNPPPRKRQANKCSRGRVNCGLLHDNMSLMWGEMKDAVDSLQDKMDTDEKEHNEMMRDLNVQLQTMTDTKVKCTNDLGEATGKRNQVTDEQNGKFDEKGEVNKEFKKVWGDCKAQLYELTYTKMCGARIVRGDVAEKGTKFKPTDIIDCEVSEFVPGRCTQPCDKKKSGIAKSGRTVLTREVVQANSTYGVECPKLSYPTDCNAILCPIDCKHSSWSSFGKCTKECEGGTKMRTRSIVREPLNGGKWCEDLVDSEPCNTMSCDRNCKLHRWSKYTLCSQACDGGYKERFRKIRVPTRGRGWCWKKMARNVRYQKRGCNKHRCQGDEQCIAKVDVVIAVDGSGSLRSTGFAMMKNFTGELVKRFIGKKYKRKAMKVGLIQFGNGEIEDDGTVSKAKIHQALTHDMKKVVKAADKMKWEMGFTNMAQAFTMSENLFRDGGRKNAQSQVVVITDGKPSFKFMTQKAVNDLRDANVHINIVAVHDHAGSKEVALMKKWASNPPESHMIHIAGMKQLQADSANLVTETLVQFCPRAQSPKLMKKKNKQRGFKLIVEKRDCLEWWYRIHRFCPNRRCRGLNDCAAAARKKGIKYFVFYGFRSRAYCYGHKRNDGKCQFKKRPWMRRKGWTRSVFSVYGLKGMKGADAAKSSMLLVEGSADKEDMKVDVRPAEETETAKEMMKEDEEGELENSDDLTMEDEDDEDFEDEAIEGDKEDA